MKCREVKRREVKCREVKHRWVEHPTSRVKSNLTRLKSCIYTTLTLYYSITFTVPKTRIYRKVWGKEKSEVNRGSR